MTKEKDVPLRSTLKNNHMNCSCLKTMPVPQCALEIVIGSTTVNNTSVYVSFTDVSTDRITIIATTTGASGQITCDLSDVRMITGNTYEVSVSEEVEGTPLDITIGTETNTCILVSFEKVRDSQGEVVIISSRTLEVA